MAKQFENGHFTGKMGAVTGRRIGDNYYIQQSQQSNPSDSDAQHQQRSKLKQLSPVVARLTPVLKETLANSTRTPYNEAMSLNMGCAFDSHGTLSMSRLVVSQGTLPLPDRLEGCIENGRLVLRWEQEGTFDRRDDDELLVAAWDGENLRPRLIHHTATRKDQHAEVELLSGEHLCWVMMRRGKRWSGSITIEN